MGVLLDKALLIATVVNTNAPLTAGSHNPVDASAGNRTMTLPITSTPGARLSVEKTDSTTNTVTITGSIRGATSTIVLLFQRDSLILIADASGSWWPISAPGAALAAAVSDAASKYAPLAAVSTVGDNGDGTLLLGGGIPTADTTVWATAASVTSAVANAQPLDSDLTAIAALSTTSFGRSLLTATSATALRDQDLLAVARYTASGKSNGTVTTLDTGQAVTNFGNSPISVVGGVLAHSPANSAQQAGYIQLDLGARVRRVGCTVAWPASSTAALAIVIPSAPWSTGVLPVAGIHLVMYGNGIWHVSRWNSGETNYADQASNGRYTDVRDGAMRPVDLWIDTAASTFTLFFPDGSSTVVSNVAIGADTSNYAIWELYETNGSPDIPATIGELWCDSYATTNPSTLTTRRDVINLLSTKSVTTLYEGINSTLSDITATGTIPSGLAYMEVIVIGATGGGGSGACVTSGTAGNGGSAGGSAGVWREIVPASALAGATTWTVINGRRGTGGTSVSTANTVGNAGTSGNQSKVSFGTTLAIAAFAGGGGPGGTTGASAPAAGGAGGPFATAGAAGPSSGAVGNAGGGITATPGTPGSGSGGGITTAGVANNGGAGGSNLLRGCTGGTAGIVGGAAPGVGTGPTGAAITAAVAGSPGPGVGGGAASVTGAAQAGATPLALGVGGGGGGASLTGNLSGSGADGIGGYVLLRAHYL